MSESERDYCVDEDGYAWRTKYHKALNTAFDDLLAQAKADLDFKLNNMRKPC